MKKWLYQCVIIGSLSLTLSACTIETVDPNMKEDKADTEPIVEQVVPEFEVRTVTASYINIEAARLNVRSDADVESSQVGAVYENEKYQIMEKKEDSQKRVWYKIQTQEGDVGYVAGWFCAQTEITIRVEEDDTVITDINVLPIPRYIDNPFDEDDVAVGDQIVGLKVKEMTEIGALQKIVFSGEITLTGNFYHERSDLAFGQVVRFVPDEASSVLLPRRSESIDSVAFIFNDYDQVASKFGELGTQGYATVVIKDYSIGYGAADAYNAATLINVTIE